MPKFAIDFCAYAQQSPAVSKKIAHYKEEEHTRFTLDTPDNSLMFHAKLGRKLIGFASVSIQKQEARIHSLFIEANYRQHGYGRKLLLAIFDTLSKSKCARIFTEAQDIFQDFFQNVGFNPVKVKTPNRHNQSPVIIFEHPVPGFFMETLKQRIQEESLSLEDGLNHLNLFQLSKDSHHYAYSSKAPFLNYHRAMLPQAQKQIWISCDTILNPVLNDEVVRDSFLQLAKRHARAEIRLLLDDDKTGAGYYNPTLELAHKLSSFFEIRALPKHTKKNNEMITTVDFSSGIYRRDSMHYAGFAHFNNHLIGQRLRDKFEDYWQTASPSLHLRRLAL